MWSKKGIYNKLNREGKSIRKYPNGDDPLKIKLFGKTRECSKCGKRKSILRFHWKTKKVKRRGLICPLSGVKMTYTLGKGDVLTNMSIDRKRSDKYYEKGNIQFVCIMANKMKNLYTNDVLYDWSKKIARNLGKSYRN